MSKLTEQVLAFHEKFGQPNGFKDSPKVPDEALVRFRLKLIAEEFFELLAAAGYYIGAVERGSVDAGDLCKGKIQREVDLPAFVDAMADLMYVIEGTAIVFGVDMEPILDEVQRANLSKTPAYVEAKDAHHKTATIKPTKPLGWKPPDIEGELKKQGWQPPAHCPNGHGFDSSGNLTTCPHCGVPLKAPP